MFDTLSTRVLRFPFMKAVNLCRWNSGQDGQLYIYGCTCILLRKNFPSALWSLMLDSPERSQSERCIFPASWLRKTRSRHMNVINNSDERTVERNRWFAQKLGQVKRGSICMSTWVWVIHTCFIAREIINLCCFFPCNYVRSIVFWVMPKSLCGHAFTYMDVWSKRNCRFPC